MVDLMRGNRVLLVEAPTGSGKSIIAPGIAYLYAQSTRNHGGKFASGFLKCVHLVRSGEQATQNANYVRDGLREVRGLVVGNYSSALSQHGRKLDNLSIHGPSIENTNYLYVTHIYGFHALAEDSKFNVVVIDEIHDFTGENIELLSRVRDKLRNGTVDRVLLLSATLSPAMKNKFMDYFEEAPSNFTAKHWKRDSIPFRIKDMPAGRDHCSQVAFRRAGHSSCNNDELYRTEADDDGKPNMEVLGKRAVETCIERIRPLIHWDPHNLPANPGLLVFLPGSADAVRAMTAVNSWLNSRNNQYVDVYLVTGQERGDLKLLDKLDSVSVRVVLSTPLLSTGVTLLGIDTVVDTGVVKIPAPYNRQGIEELEVVWQDGIQMMQRRGRVGRTAPGFVFQCYSPKRAAEMSRTDNTLKHIQRGYTTAHLAGVLNDFERLMVKPDPDVMRELMLEAGITGFFHIDLRYPNIHNCSSIDAIGLALSRCFSNLPLDCGLFLIMCASYNVLLSGLVFIASYLAKHSATMKPSKGDDVPGRNDFDLLINRWPVFSHCDDISDLMVYAEIIVNAILNGPGRGRGGFVLELPNWFKENVFNEGLMEVWRHICNLANGLRHLRLIREFKDIFTYDRSGIVVRDIGQFTIARLNNVHNNLFKIAIVTAFGHRPLDQATETRDSKHTLFSLSKTHKSPDGSSVHLVQGERAKKTPLAMVAVYQSVFKHTPKESFLTAYIHQCTPTDLLLHGNVYGCYYDIVDEAAGTLTVHTNGYNLLFEFEDGDLLKLVVEFRRLQKLIPGACLLGEWRFTEQMRLFMKNLDQNLYPKLELTRINDPTRAVHSIDNEGYFQSPRDDQRQFIGGSFLDRPHHTGALVNPPRAIGRAVPPGDIVTQPGTKIVFNAPFDKHTCHIQVTNSSDRRIGWTVKTNRKRHWARPIDGVLDPKENALIAVSCDAFAYGQEDTSKDCVTIEWIDTPNGALKQFNHEWFEDEGVSRRKKLRIEYNP